jgi:diguanylate cyclase (GGDEF)-like protein
VSSSVLERLQRLPRFAVLLLGLAAIAGIAWLDSVTGPKLMLNVFYLLPVMFVAWVTASTPYGLLAVLATFVVGPLETYLDGLGFYSLPMAAWNAGMRTAVFCIVLLLLAEVRKLVARLQEQSLTDELTGVANRRAFLDVAAREIERSRRYQHELSLAYLDIDAFKAANDRFGHAVGDRVLIALAGVARATARSVDTVARIGGDEFVILMPETDARAALPLAERLRTACSRAAGLGAAPITCSIGLVTFERAPGDVEELLTSADALMYEAKAAGGDGVRHALLGAARSTAADGRLLPFAQRSGA